MVGSAVPLPAAVLASEASSTAVAAIQGLMRQEEETCAELLSLAHRKRDLIVATNPAALIPLMAEEERLIARVQALEKARLRELAPWAAAVGQPAEALTVTDLATVLPEPTRSDLLAARDRLRQQVDTLAQANGENAALLQGCIGLLADSIAHLLQATVHDPHYAHDGKRAGALNDDSPHLLDYHA